MTRHLTGTVHVQDDAGNDHAFGPDDEVPAWAAKKITNPVAWEGLAEEESEPDDPKPPAGNAGTDEWRAYATDVLGIPAEQVADLGRDAIKGLIEERDKAAAGGGTQ